MGRGKLDAFRRVAKGTIDQLQPIANDSSDGNHSEASSLLSDLKSRRDKLDDQTRDLLNGPAVIDYVMRKSESARSDHRGRCSARDVSLDGGSVIVDDGKFREASPSWRERCSS